MSDVEAARRPAAGTACRYQVGLLRDARVSPAGVHHRVAGGEVLLEWERVRLAVASEVGEPEGVRTIVFDLVVGCEADRVTVCRLHADPGDDAVAIAQGIEACIDSSRRGPSIKSLAEDGIASQWHPDLEAFAEAVLELVSR